MNSTKQLYLFSLDVFIYIRVVVFMINMYQRMCVFLDFCISKKYNDIGCVLLFGYFGRMPT